MATIVTRQTGSSAVNRPLTNVEVDNNFINLNNEINVDDYPTIFPSLNLDFAKAKVLDPRITFTRASEGRFYDGRTFAKAEENLLLRSQDFTTTWATARTVRTANTDTAPDGTVTADSIVQASGQTTGGTLNQAIGVVASDYVFSIFAKPNGKNFIAIRETLLDGTENTTWFNVQAGTVGTTDADHVATISASTNSYFRCVIKLTANAARTGAVALFLADTDNSIVVTDSGGVFLWGAQLEQRSSVTAYTPTTTAPITNYIPVLQTAAANVARFDHNPVTGESLGLLIEESRSNLLLRSEEFETASWTKARATVTANTVVAPDGTLTADKLVEDTTASNTHLIQVQNAGQTFVSGTIYTHSIFVKAAGRTSFVITWGVDFGTFAGESATFDLSANAVTTSGSITASIQSVGSGWYRCITTATALASAAGVIRLQPAIGGNISYTGDGYSGIFIWGAQLEAGAFATSYIPTVASQVTRQADAASMTGVNFSSWYRQDEGTVHLDAFSNPNLATDRAIFSISDGTLNNRIVIPTGGNNAVWNPFVITGNVSQGTSPPAGVNPKTNSRVAFTFKTNDFIAAAAGVLGANDTSATLPVVDRAFFGADGGGTSFANTHIRRLAFYPQRLTNAALQALTT
jgi:hypothetical protein